MKEEEYKANRDADAIDVAINKNRLVEEETPIDEKLEESDLNHGFPVEENEYVVKNELAAYVDGRLSQLGVDIPEDKLEYLYSEYYAELVENGLTEDDYEGHDDLLFNAIDSVKTEGRKM